MKKTTRHTLRLLMACILTLSVLLSSCSDKDDGPKAPQGTQLTVLVYAISSNSLSTFFDTDLDEMFTALRNVSHDNYRLLVFNAGYTPGTYTRGVPTLTEYYAEADGTIKSRLLKSYTTDLYATQPERINEVTADMRKFAPAPEYGLVLWSHSMSWAPGYSTYGTNPRTGGIFSRTDRRWFGDDGGKHTDIHDLASALPDGLFHFIWMDCCYMSNIESMYQLRNKARYYVGYPTEALGDGAPYDLILPRILRQAPDLKGAAEEFFRYYNSQQGIFRSATVAVADLSKIEGVMLAARDILQDFHAVNADGLQRYHRGSHTPAYDLRDFLLSAGASSLTPQRRKALDDALDAMTVYKAATPDFLLSQRGFVIDPDHFCGFSTHLYKGESSEDEDFYRTLDWYRDVFPSE